MTTVNIIETTLNRSCMHANMNFVYAWAGNNSKLFFYLFWTVYYSQCVNPISYIFHKHHIFFPLILILKKILIHTNHKKVFNTQANSPGRTYCCAYEDGDAVEKGEYHWTVVKQSVECRILHPQNWECEKSAINMKKPRYL